MSAEDIDLVNSTIYQCTKLRWASHCGISVDVTLFLDYEKALKYCVKMGLELYPSLIQHRSKYNICLDDFSDEFCYLTHQPFPTMKCDSKNQGLLAEYQRYKQMCKEKLANRLRRGKKIYQVDEDGYGYIILRIQENQITV